MVQALAVAVAMVVLEAPMEVAGVAMVVVVAASRPAAPATSAARQVRDAGDGNDITGYGINGSFVSVFIWMARITRQRMYRMQSSLSSLQNLAP